MELHDEAAAWQRLDPMRGGRRDIYVLACLEVKGGTWDGLENETQAACQDPKTAPKAGGYLVRSE